MFTLLFFILLGALLISLHWAAASFTTTLCPACTWGCFKSRRPCQVTISHGRIWTAAWQSQGHVSWWLWCYEKSHALKHSCFGLYIIIITLWRCMFRNAVGSARYVGCDRKVDVAQLSDILWLFSPTRTSALVVVAWAVKAPFFYHLCAQIGAKNSGFPTTSFHRGERVSTTAFRRRFLLRPTYRDWEARFWATSSSNAPSLG